MFREKRTRVIAGVVTALLAVTVGSTASQARPATQPDPERVTHAYEARVTAADIPAAVDSDLYAYTVSATGRSYFVVAGHLKLKRKAGSKVLYTGNLIDYSGRASYEASADITKPDAPILRFHSKNGAFRFKATSAFGSPGYSATGLIVPKALGTPAKKVFVSASAHASKSAAYTITLSQRVGAPRAITEYTGTMTLVYDANNRISGGVVTVEDSQGREVSHTITGTGFYASGGYFYTVALIDKSWFGIHASINSSGGLDGFAFTGTGSAMSQWVVSGAAA